MVRESQIRRERAHSTSLTAPMRSRRLLRLMRLIGSGGEEGFGGADRIGEMAGGGPASAARLESRFLLTADRLGHRAARMEGTAGRRRERARQLAARRRRASVRRPGTRPRRGLRAGPACRGGAGAAKSASVGPISTMRPRYITAMRWEMWRTTARSCAMKRYGQAELVLQLQQQVDDLRLHRDVEGRDRLVGDDALGLDRERPGDADALPLAARELVRVARCRRRPAAARGPAARRRGRRLLGAAAQPVDAERLAERCRRRVMRGLSEP